MREGGEVTFKNCSWLSMSSLTMIYCILPGTHVSKGPIIPYLLLLMKTGNQATHIVVDMAVIQAHRPQLGCFLG